MRQLKIYTDGSYSKNEALRVEQIPEGREEAFKDRIGFPGHVTHGGFVVLDGDTDTPIAFVRINCTIKPFVDTWNNGGETVAAFMAVKWAHQYFTEKNKVDGYEDSEVVIYHDYMGVSEWIKPHGNKKWKTTSPCSKIYVDLMNNLMKMNSYALKFVKVHAHSGDKWNEVADAIAGGKQNQHITKKVEVINV